MAGRSRRDPRRSICRKFAPIGVDVKGGVWACVEMPDSAEF